MRTRPIDANGNSAAKMTEDISWKKMVEMLCGMPTAWKFVGGGVLTVLGWTLISKFRRILFLNAVKKRQSQIRQENDKRKQEFARRIKYKQSEVNTDEVVSLSLIQLQEKLQKGVYTPSQVLLAYLKKAIEVDEVSNCVTRFIEEAEDWAAELDKATEKGPLYGIPFSIKESHNLKGYSSTRGFHGWADDKANKSMLPNEVLIKQGAIPFVQSNVPYLCLSYSCCNRLFGSTCNPLDRRRHPGGSSGGEAALLAGGGSVLSLGSDIGGSVRVPCAWCGLVGLKTSSLRISRKNNLVNHGLGTILPVCFGPMSRDVESAAFVMRHLLTENQYKQDFSIAPLPWREEIYRERRPLKIGFYDHNDVFEPVPAVRRAVRLTKQKLEELGHQVVPFQVAKGPQGSSWNCANEFMGVVTSDRGRSLNLIREQDASGEELTLPDEPFPKLPRCFNLAVATVVGLVSSEMKQRFVLASGTGSTFGWWQLVATMMKWREEVADAFNRAELDAILCPITPCPAMYLDQNPQGGQYMSYSSIYNMLDWTAGVLPVTKVTEQDITDMKNYPDVSVTEKNRMKLYHTAKYYKMVHECMVGSEGLPIAVQLVTPPYQEELCLSIMKQIEQALA